MSGRHLNSARAKASSQDSPGFLRLSYESVLDDLVQAQNHPAVCKPRKKSRRASAAAAEQSILHDRNSAETTAGPFQKKLQYRVNGSKL